MTLEEKIIKGLDAWQPPPAPQMKDAAKDFLRRVDDVARHYASIAEGMRDWKADCLQNRVVVADQATKIQELEEEIRELRGYELPIDKTYG